MVKRFVTLMSLICMTLVTVPNLSVQAADMGAFEGNEVYELVSDYMEGRENAITIGNVENLEDVAVMGIVNDEIVHKEVLSENGISISDMSYQIVEVDIEDTMTFVTLNESIEYVVNGATENAEIEHSLFIMNDEDGIAKVLSDKYDEKKSGFQSCSFVTEEDEAASKVAKNLRIADLRSELIAVAQDEVGYLEKASNSNLNDFTANAGSNNYTKYGEWYGLNGKPWCAIFVSWCANMVEVPTTAIPKYASCTTGMESFKNAGCFYYSSANGGDYTPKYGDIFFIGTKTSSNHTGIVTSVSGSTITVVDGNWGDKVSEHTYKLTDSSLAGFASPSY